ncbi:addiction module protein [Gemmata sp. G18]|uniref:Addiction module protein n=1 Tax=Gemmata palustris TaxID=2822762 RepID=A0ABS5C179_9BACT|nr:addiction module protein [Gemmata palustris]MBP3959753.1 addiction module protein [Gemmata palustris]
MSEAAEKLKTAILELPLAERLEVMDALAASLPPDDVTEDNTAFDAVLQRRAEDLDSGRVKGVPANEVMERLRAKYAK